MRTTLPIGLIQRSRLVRAVYCKWLAARQDLLITVTVEADDTGQYIRQMGEVGEESHPRIVVVEASDGGDDEMKKIARLKTEFPGQKILVVSTQTEGRAVLDMLKAGADGYLTTDAEPEELLEALRLTARQGYYYPDWVIGLLIRYLRNTDPGVQPHLEDSGIDFMLAKGGGHFFIPAEEYVLSDREKSILSLLASEATYADIAEQLCISVRTVQVHVYNLCKKFRVNNRMGLVMQVLKNNSRLS